MARRRRAATRQEVEQGDVLWKETASGKTLVGMPIGLGVAAGKYYAQKKWGRRLGKVIAGARYYAYY
jgi:hypothetical protein